MCLELKGSGELEEGGLQSLEEHGGGHLPPRQEGRGPRTRRRRWYLGRGSCFRTTRTCPTSGGGAGSVELCTRSLRAASELTSGPTPHRTPPTPRVRFASPHKGLMLGNAPDGGFIRFTQGASRRATLKPSPGSGAIPATGLTSPRPQYVEAGPWYLRLGLQKRPVAPCYRGHLYLGPRPQTPLPWPPLGFLGTVAYRSPLPLFPHALPIRYLQRSRIQAGAGVSTSWRHCSLCSGTSRGR